MLRHFATITDSFTWLEARFKLSS